MLECVHGYLRGTRPPGKKGDFENMYLAIENIIDAHCAAYDIIKKYNPRSKVSISKNMVDFEKQYRYDLIKSNIEDQIIENYNYCILDAFYKGVLKFGIEMFGLGSMKTREDKSWIGKLDFLGVNHYNVGYVVISYNLKKPIDVKLKLKDSIYHKNAMKWDIKPESMLNVLDGLRMRYGKIKIMITESGSAEKNAHMIGNLFQKEIIDTHFRSVIEYQKKHHTILGYIYWTLMDNYEWEDGYKPKFGLYTMSYKKGKRVCLLKDSGEYYREAIANAKK
jgi:beta-glucosidase